MEGEPFQDTWNQEEMLTWVFSFSGFLFSELLFLRHDILKNFPNSHRESEKISGFNWEKSLSKMMEILVSIDPFIGRGPRVFQERWTISSWSWMPRTFQYHGWAHDSDIAGFSQCLVSGLAWASGLSIYLFCVFVNSFVKQCKQQYLFHVDFVG